MGMCASAEKAEKKGAVVREEERSSDRKPNFQQSKIKIVDLPPEDDTITHSNNDFLRPSNSKTSSATVKQLEGRAGDSKTGSKS